MPARSGPVRWMVAAGCAGVLVVLGGVGCSDAGATIPDGWENRRADGVSFGLPPGLEPTPDGDLEPPVMFRATGGEFATLLVAVSPADASPDQAEAQAGIRRGQRQLRTPGFRGGPIEGDVEVPGAASAAVLSWTQEVDGEVVTEGKDLVALTEGGQAVVVAYVDAAGQATKQRIDQLFDSVVVSDPE